jgi:hypothetical protein
MPDFDTIGRGALGGAALGAVLAGVTALLYQNAPDLDLEVPGLLYVSADTLLAEALAQYKPLRGHSDAMRASYEAMVRHCDDVLRYCALKKSGAAQAKAHRAMNAAVDTARRLCHDALAVHQDDRGAELLRDVESMQSLCGNHLHNAMLD